MWNSCFGSISYSIFDPDGLKIGYFPLKGESSRPHQEKVGQDAAIIFGPTMKGDETTWRVRFPMHVEHSAIYTPWN